MNEGDAIKGKELCLKAISIDPKSVKAHYLLGKLHKILGSIEEAKSEFIQTLQLQQDSKEAKKELESLSKVETKPP